MRDYSYEPLRRMPSAVWYSLVINSADNAERKMSLRLKSFEMLNCPRSISSGMIVQSMEKLFVKVKDFPVFDELSVPSYKGLATGALFT